MNNDGALAGRLIAIDVDGTLLQPDGTVAQRTIDAVTAAADAGAVVTLATGRDWNGVALLLQQIPAISYAACVNGIEIFTSDGAELTADEIDPSVAAQIVTDVRAVVPGVAVGIGIDSNLTGEPLIDEVMPPGLAHIVVVDDILDALTTGIRDIVLYHPDYHEDLDPFFGLVDSVVAGIDGAETAYTGLPMIEVVPPGAGKDAAMAWLCGHLGLRREDAVAIGDGMNDLAMLGWAGTGVVMGQARKEVRAAGDVVTLSNAQHGLAAWLEAAASS